MRILGLETATPQGSIAVVDGAGLLAESTTEVRRGHSRTLLPRLEELLARAGLEHADIDGVAVSLGPGSFTGLRVGLAAAKGLALARDLPLVGVPTLTALAANAALSGEPIWALLDARRDQVYAAEFSVGPGGLRSVGSATAIAPEELARSLAGSGEGALVLLGSGAVHYREVFRSALGDRVRFAPPELAFPRAGAVARLGRERLVAGDTDDPEDLAPLYLRGADVRTPQMKRSR